AVDVVRSTETQLDARLRPLRRRLGFLGMRRNGAGCGKKQGSKERPGWTHTSRHSRWLRREPTPRSHNNRSYQLALEIRSSGLARTLSPWIDQACREQPTQRVVVSHWP